MQGFEPYVFVSKKHIPWFDERFSGYLENKLLFSEHLHHLGFTFLVHPGAFMVHYPHEQSEAELQVKGSSLAELVGTCSTPQGACVAHLVACIT